MAGFERFVSLLRLFNERQNAWTVQEMSEALDVPASTIYRTVRDLVEGGFLDPAPEARYRLGSAFIEFDRLIRLTDPLVQAGRAVLSDAVAQAAIPSVGLLSRLSNGMVMCIADRTSGNADFQSSYERGRPMPLTRGATSKAILAHLPWRRVQKLIEHDSGLGGKPEEFREHLAAIRKRGHIVSRGEIDNGLVGIAAPVVVPELDLYASLSLVAEERTLDEVTERRLIMIVAAAAGFLAGELRAALPLEAQPESGR